MVIVDDGATPGNRPEDIGTPNEYTNNIYEVYFEVGEYENIALGVFEKYLGEKKDTIRKSSHGYLLRVPIQAVPDLVRLLNENNIAVYQIVRYARTNDQW